MVTDAVERELAAIPRVAESALAATALTLAREMDNPKTSATAKAMCARVLREVLVDIHALAPEEKVDKLDQLVEKRLRRVK